MVALADAQAPPALAAKRPIPLYGRQLRFVEDAARYPAAIGGIGSGKSYVGAAKVIARLNRPGLGMIAAPTYPMLRDATRRSLMDHLGRLGIEYTLNKGENVLIILGSGHEVLFRSLDNPETLRGPNLEWAWVDEAALIAADAWRIVKGRVRTGPNPQAWITGTPKGRNWMWEEWERDADPDHPLYRFRTDENPALPGDFAASLGYTGAFAAQELGGEFVAFEGLVYPGFRRNVHVRPVETDGWRTVMGADVGARNPTAVLTIHVAGDGRTHVSREFYRRNLSSREIILAIETEADTTLPERIHIDPSAAGYIADLWRDGYPAEKANNDVLTGVQRVATAIGDGLTVDPSCVQTIAEFESYRYPEGRREADKPLKENDHAMDALRYAMLGEAEPVMEVNIW